MLQLLQTVSVFTRDTTDQVPVCQTGNNFDGRIGLRISALFVILLGSTTGAVFPVFAYRHKRVGVPEWAFFVAKYFGSGVIIATAFIHVSMSSGANDALRNPCLTGPITEYDWVNGICLMAIFALFFVELMAMRFAIFAHPDDDPVREVEAQDKQAKHTTPRETSNVPGDDHLGHAREHVDAEFQGPHDDHIGVETYSAQLTAIFILEFGVIFHSIFVGLTLAVSGTEFTTLYVVLVFHQTFEGLGLGSRLAVVPWPQKRRWTPYIMAVSYGLSTPISIAIGLGLRQSYVPGSATALIVNGIFDSISAGILIYTGLVELLAHEFMFSQSMRKASLQHVLTAFAIMCLGAGLMALLGKWA